MTYQDVRSVPLHLLERLTQQGRCWRPCGCGNPQLFDYIHFYDRYYADNGWVDYIDCWRGKSDWLDQVEYWGGFDYIDRLREIHLRHQQEDTNIPKGGPA